MTAPWDGDRVFIIAEAGSNWRMGTGARDLEMAKTLIDAAAEARADAVKFQTYRADALYVANAGDSDYLAAAGIREPITEILRDLEMPYGMIPALARHAADRGIRFMSTPFSSGDFAAVDPHVSVHKIASYEISHLRLLELAGRSGKPLILSTGASQEEDVAWAVEIFRKAGGHALCLMQCTASYPAPPESLNLRAIPRLASRFGLPVGLSDHSRDPVLAPVAAVALGARAIEKHFTLDNRLPGPDHAFAVTPEELGAMVRAVRATEAALGAGRKEVLPEETELAAYARRGIQALRDIPRGEALHEGGNIDILRPGKQPLGLHPKALPEIEGRKALRDIRRGEGIRPGDFGD
jgi:sialic acid synthase SpsE